VCLPAQSRLRFSQNLLEVDNFELSTNLSDLGELVSAGDMIDTHEDYLNLLL